MADGWLKKAENVYAETGICNFLLQINTKKDNFFLPVIMKNVLPI